MSWLLDTNVVLYFLGGRLAQPLPQGIYYASIITEIEVLSYPGLDAHAERQIRSFLGNQHRRAYRPYQGHGDRLTPSPAAQSTR